MCMIFIQESFKSPSAVIVEIWKGQRLYNHNMVTVFVKMHFYSSCYKLICLCIYMHSYAFIHCFHLCYAKDKIENI